MANTERYLKVLADGKGRSEFTIGAWINFNGQGTVAIRDSHNVSSIADNATGNYTVNFSNNIGANYCVTTSCRYNNQKVGTFSGLMATDNVGIVSSGMGGSTLTDSDTVMVNIMGDN